MQSYFCDFRPQLGGVAAYRAAVRWRMALVRRYTIALLSRYAYLTGRIG